MKRTIASCILFLSFAVFVTLPTMVFADTGTSASEIHILPNGTFTAKNVLVFQKSGKNFFCRVLWGNSFVRLMVLVHDDTVITTNHGGKMTVDTIADKDILTIEGTLGESNESIVVHATKIKDQSSNTEQKTFSGSIKSVNPAGGSFVLTSKEMGVVTVALGTANDVPIKKGARTVSISELKMGDKVLSVSGPYTFTNTTLVASALEVYQDPKVFVAKDWTGTLKNLSGTSLPVTAVITVSGIDYTVYLPAAATVSNKAKVSVALARVTAGDTVTVRGSIRKINLTEIDATSLRDLSF